MGRGAGSDGGVEGLAAGLSALEEAALSGAGWLRDTSNPITPATNNKAKSFFIRLSFPMESRLWIA